MDSVDKNLTIKAAIEFVLKRLGLQEAEKGLKGLGDKAKDTGEKLRKPGDSAKKTSGDFRDMTGASEHLGRTLTRFLGAAALGALVKTSLTEFAKVERSWNSLAIMMDNLGLSARENLPAVRKELEALAAAGDGALAETIPAFQTFLGLTKNVAASMELVKLSANIAETGLMDFASAASTLESVVSGRATRSLAQLGINLKEDADGAIDAREALALLFDRFPDQIRALDDTQDALDRQTAAFTEFYTVVGEGLSQLLGMLPSLSVFTNSIQSLGVLGGEALMKLGIGFRFVGDIAKSFFDSIAFGDFTSFGKGVKAAYETAGRDLKIAIETRTEELDRIWADAGVDAGAAYGDGVTKAAEEAAAKEKALAIAGAEADRKRREEQAKGAEKAAEKRAEIERAAEEKLQQAKVAIAEEGSQERLDLELQALDQQKAEAIRLAGDSAKAVAAIEEAFLIARALKQKEHLDAQKEATDAWAEETTQTWEEWLAEIVAAAAAMREADRDSQKSLRETQLLDLEEFSDEWLEIKLASLEEERVAEVEEKGKTAAAVAAIEERYRLLKLQAEAKNKKAEDKIVLDTKEKKIAAAIEISQAGIVLGNTLFGETKALMIAQAIVDTWAGANRALAMEGWAGIALASIIVAIGLANVAKIRATKKEGGGGKGGGTFDDPQNDRMAFLGGRKSVEDFIRLTSRGHQDALRELLPRLATREGRHSAINRAELMEIFGGHDREGLAKDIKGLVGLIRDNINAGDPTGGIPEKYLGDWLTAASSRLASHVVSNIGRGGLAALADGGRGGPAPPPAPADGSRDALPAPASAGGGDTIINIGNVYGGDPGLRQLSRELERAGRLDRRLLK